MGAGGFRLEQSQIQPLPCSELGLNSGAISRRRQGISGANSAMVTRIGVLTPVTLATLVSEEAFGISYKVEVCSGRR